VAALRQCLGRPPVPRLPLKVSTGRAIASSRPMGCCAGGGRRRLIIVALNRGHQFGDLEARAAPKTEVTPPIQASGIEDQLFRTLHPEDIENAYLVISSNVCVLVCFFFAYTGGDFGGQISSLEIPTKFFRTVLRKYTKIFRREICPLRNLLATKSPGTYI
jgi:hypothetical protein